MVLKTRNKKTLNKTAISLLMCTACVEGKRVIMDRHQRVVSVPHECFDLVLNHSEIITASAVYKNIHRILVKEIAAQVGVLSWSFSSTELTILCNASLSAAVPGFGFDKILQCHCA